MTELLRSPVWEPAEQERLLTREWLVTNGLGGYASGTVSGAVTRRYHGLLVAALPAPLGRTVMLNHLVEELRLPGGVAVSLGGIENSTGVELPGASFFADFHLDSGLPVWRYRVDGFLVEKRILMPHSHNTVMVLYRLLEGSSDRVRLRLRPSVHFRGYEEPVDAPLDPTCRLAVSGDRYEIHSSNPDLPPLRLMQRGGENPVLVLMPQHHTAIAYRIERDRGYPAIGHLWSPGYLRAELTVEASVALVASTEPWTTILGMPAELALGIELDRRRRLVSLAPPTARAGVAAELVLAADQFITTPAGRVAEQARAQAAGRELRTVIAGYHWFTDWGRDTMISLEGLTLCTGRHREASDILRTFAAYVRDGLIPNMFPDHATDGLYHTADATLWFFHAADRYVRYTGDRSLIADLLPIFGDIVQHHLDGTHFGIRIDPADGLLSQGAEGYQLTWMDAKVEDWVVTPRRGKAVELNALWYNALRLLEQWSRGSGDSRTADTMARHAARACASFNERFWYDGGQYLYDVIDGENGADDACRPNQIFAISLDHPVLERTRWNAVIETVGSRLLTPAGLRSLAPGHPDYQPKYWGDLRARDAAYHQGTVWGWLIGPFIDAWLRCHPDDKRGARAMLAGLIEHLDEFGVGTIAEIFDAEEPYSPRGCIAQAWSVAEVLKCWVRTEAG
ncbi:MAG TPA: amylo-alpha-1,6-glucosidase [Longimicrobiales bacterium]